jgi:hypothetical protein
MQISKNDKSRQLTQEGRSMKGENQEAACRLENAIIEGTGHNLVTNEEKGLTING